MSEPQCSRIPALGLNPPHAQIALSLNTMISDGLLSPRAAWMDDTNSVRQHKQPHAKFNGKLFIVGKRIKRRRI